MVQSSNEGNSLSKYTNLLPVGAAIVAVALGWGEMRNQMSSNREFQLEAQRDFKDKLDTLNGIYDKLEDRIRDLEKQTARADERFTLILTLMTELKSQVAVLAENEKKSP